jgi:integrase
MYEKGPGSRPQAGSNRRGGLPEYLTAEEVNSVLALTKKPKHRLLMLIMWRAGLRVSEALNVGPDDIVSGDQPALRVRHGKGGKPRLVPLHPELLTALEAAAEWGGSRGRIIPVHRATAWRWIKLAADRAVKAGELGPERHIGDHTFRHSAARHWLASGVPINVVSRWLGHASIQTTLIYLEVLPDQLALMERVP